MKKNKTETKSRINIKRKAKDENKNENEKEKKIKQNIYIYRCIYFSIKNAINTNCLIIDDPILLCKKDSQGVVINI